MTRPSRKAAEPIRARWEGLGPWFTNSYNGVFLADQPEQAVAWVEDVPNPEGAHGDELHTELGKRHLAAITQAPEDVQTLLAVLDATPRCVEHEGFQAWFAPGESCSDCSVKGPIVELYWPEPSPNVMYLCPKCLYRRVRLAGRAPFRAEHQVEIERLARFWIRGNTPVEEVRKAIAEHLTEIDHYLEEAAHQADLKNPPDLRRPEYRLGERLAIWITGVVGHFAAEVVQVKPDLRLHVEGWPILKPGDYTVLERLEGDHPSLDSAAGEK